MRLFLFITFLTLGAMAEACIFQSKDTTGHSAFWPSRQIEVCFLPPQAKDHISAPNPMDNEYLQRQQAYRRVVEKTLRKQINDRTVFNMQGFGTCDPSDKSDKIRIDLNGAGGGGGGGAMSIGPRASKHYPNLEMVTVNAIWPNHQKPDMTKPFPDRLREFQSNEHISWLALHEVLHLLGIHHEDHWNTNIKDPYVDEVIQVGEKDEQSVMAYHREFDSNGLAVLSEGDVRCVNHIGNRSILNFPSRKAQARPPSAAERRPREKPLPTTAQ